MKWSDWSMPRIPAVKAEGSEGPDNPLLHSKLEGSLGCMKPFKKASVSIVVAEQKSSADIRLANGNKVIPRLILYSLQAKNQMIEKVR